MYCIKFDLVKVIFLLTLQSLTKSIGSQTWTKQILLILNSLLNFPKIFYEKQFWIYIENSRHRKRTRDLRVCGFAIQRLPLCCLQSSLRSNLIRMWFFYISNSTKQHYVKCWYDMWIECKKRCPFRAHTVRIWYCLCRL